MITIIILSAGSTKAVVPLIPFLLKGLFAAGKKHGLKKAVVDTAKDAAKDKIKEEVQKKKDDNKEDK